VRGRRLFRSRQRPRGPMFGGAFRCKCRPRDWAMVLRSGCTRDGASRPCPRRCDGRIREPKRSVLVRDGRCAPSDDFAVSPFFSLVKTTFVQRHSCSGHNSRRDMILIIHRHDKDSQQEEQMRHMRPKSTLFYMKKTGLHGEEQRLLRLHVSQEPSYVPRWCNQ
jgi:hypothetical protein